MRAFTQQNLIRKEDGSVLLETVIAIPLFMLLIGGTIWIGQLSYDKQKLVVADRYVAWNVGNRANPSFRESDVQKDVHEKFFASLETEQVTIDRPIGKKDRWGHEAWGGVELDVTMPVWTYGFLLAGQTNPTDTGTIQTNVVGLRGRDIPDWPDEQTGESYYRGHVVLMRSGLDGARTNGVLADADLAAGYTNTWNDPWPEDVEMAR